MRSSTAVKILNKKQTHICVWYHNDTYHLTKDFQDIVSHINGEKVFKNQETHLPRRSAMIVAYCNKPHSFKTVTEKMLFTIFYEQTDIVPVAYF